jgi:hypothetical protein
MKWFGAVWLLTGQVADSCEHGNEFSLFHKMWRTSYLNDRALDEITIDTVRIGFARCENFPL